MKKIRQQNCDDRCLNAVSEECDCICLGKNHGKTWESTLKSRPSKTITGGKDKIIGRIKNGAVYINGNLLDSEESQGVYNHSPNGFSWGYGGSGPAQLALALLLHWLDVAKAQKYYQQFKWDVIATLPKEDFEISTKVITAWIKTYTK